MVVLYAAGKRLGTWAESEHLFLEAMRYGPVECRDESGKFLCFIESVSPYDSIPTIVECDRPSAGGDRPR